MAKLLPEVYAGTPEPAVPDYVREFGTARAPPRVLHCFLRVPVSQAHEAELVGVIASNEARAAHASPEVTVVTLRARLYAAPTAAGLGWGLTRHPRSGKARKSGI